MTKTVLLTGASGFVGRQILRQLRAAGVPVRATARGAGAALLEAAGGVEVLRVDDLFARPAAWWARACAGVDTVIHAAWYAEPGKYLHSPLNLACLQGTLALAEGCVGAKVRRFVGIGTCMEYAFSAAPLSVAAPLRPVTPYAGAKAAAFMALSTLLPAQGVGLAWCRLFNLYGEGEDGRRLLPRLRSRLSAGLRMELVSGAQLRDYLDVREAGRLIAEVALGGIEGPYNICSGRAVSVREIAERIADEYGRRDLLAFGAWPEDPLDPPNMVGVPGNQE